jgi:transcriptional regulator with PAS, ATPase and Fis domain
VLRAIARVASTESTVLLRGATGTGKEVIARAIHEESPRRSKPFIAVNCSALAEGLLESELFGHARGAFTGAVGERKGMFEEANGGTLFLDEVGDVSPGMQARLLRVLQEREIVRVGTSRSVPVDVRVVAATHRDLEAMVEDGRFRKDLYFRLKVFQIRVPELKDRVEDIPQLAAAALARWNEKVEPSRRIGGISDEALEVMAAYDWPGNVRELENALERAAVMTPGEEIGPGALPAKITERAPQPLVQASLPPNPTLEIIERAYIHWVLQAEGGNKTRAAEVLGIDPSTLYRKLLRYGMETAG